MTSSRGTLHILTAEFPPQIGGVSDHAYQIASGLASSGVAVHVWCRDGSGSSDHPTPGVTVHRAGGAFRGSDLYRLGAELDGFPAPRRLLVQWVPHSYGMRSLNLPFCLWLWRRARQGDRVELMVHEPGMPFSLAHPLWNVSAVVHRTMAAILLRAASRVWFSAPRWQARWAPYRFGRRVAFDWLPLPNGVPIVRDPTALSRLRTDLHLTGRPVFGYFGMIPGGVAPILEAWISGIFRAHQEAVALLIGKGSAEFRAGFAERHPESAARVLATGALPADQLSLHLQLLDVAIQPFDGGVNARRSSVVVLLAHGIPTVTTRGRFTEEFWVESGAVALLSDRAPEEAAGRIAGLIRNSAEREALAELGRLLYDSRFSIDVAVGKLLRPSSGPLAVDAVS